MLTIPQWWRFFQDFAKRLRDLSDLFNLPLKLQGQLMATNTSGPNGQDFVVPRGTLRRQAVDDAGQRIHLARTNQEPGA